MDTVDEWRKQFPVYTDSFLSSYAKKIFKGAIKLYTLGPYVVSLPESAQVFPFELKGFYNLYYLISAGGPLPSSLTLSVAGEVFYLTGTTDLLVEFSDGGGRGFVIYTSNGPEDLLVCALVEKYCSVRASTFATLKQLSVMLNDPKMRENAHQPKFLIKTIKPRA